MKRVKEEDFLNFTTPADALEQALLDNPTDVAYNLSAYYPKVIFRALDALIRFASSEGPLQKRALKILLRISVNSDIDSRYRKKARCAIRNT